MKSTSKRTVMNAIFCFKVQWTTPALENECTGLLLLNLELKK